MGGGVLEEDDVHVRVFILLNELDRVVKLELHTIHAILYSTTIHMHNTDTSMEENMVPDKENSVQRPVSNTSPPLPSERPDISLTSEYHVLVLRDVEAAVSAAPDSLQQWAGYWGVVVHHNETEEVGESICFKGWYLCKLLECTLRSSYFKLSMLQEAHNECREPSREQLVMVVMTQF